jgi:hypothetical protein
MGVHNLLHYEQIVHDLVQPEITEIINSLPAQCHTTMDRLLRERPISNPDDNWLTRLGKLRYLNREEMMAIIEAWRAELDRTKPPPGLTPH